MTTVCQSALLEIQYFVARDFRLDGHLYAHCSEDAVKYCHADKNWNRDVAMIGPQPNPLVLPCLYRYSNHPKAGSKVIITTIIYFIYMILLHSISSTLFSLFFPPFQILNLIFQFYHNRNMNKKLKFGDDMHNLKTH